jgi:arylsulfatase A-like enzyme
LTAAETFWVAAGAAIWTGLLEVAIEAVRAFLLRELIFRSRDFFWMAPLGYALWFLPLGGLIVGVGVVARRWVTLGRVVALFVFLGALSNLLSLRGIASLASVVLALGLGVRLGFAARQHPSLTVRFARRSTLAGLLLVPMLGIAGRALAWRDPRLGGGRPPAAGADPPNVLLIVLDTVRRPNLSLYGYSRPTTPHLIERAAQSIVFDHALSTAPWTLPSHGTLFTGRYPPEWIGDWRIPHRGTEPTLAGVLRARGYHTAGFVANLLYTTRESGLAAGFEHYDDYPVSWYQLIHNTAFGRSTFYLRLSQSRSLRDVARAVRRFDLVAGQDPAHEFKPAPAVTDAFLAWHASNRDRPFFAFLNYFDAHEYRAPEEYLRRFAPDTSDQQARYDASIAYLDQEVDRLLGELDRRGALDRTIVAITSDHGEQFGEHGLKLHANSLYLPVLDVPLVIRYPAAGAGRRVDRTVSLRDLPATLLDLAGASATLPGTSLRFLWEPELSGTPSPAASFLSQGIGVNAKFPNGRGSLASLTGDTLRYIAKSTGEEELYDVRTDPAELHNLATADTVAAKRMGAALAAARSKMSREPRIH